MTGGTEGTGRDAATIFFKRIEDETGTTVIWPSRLKIGAKSKKDPHIRVGGQDEEAVKIAKARITEVLDTRVNSRVTMKMDVSYTDHSHIIGKGGNTIRRVMADTKCHIHFPDSNRSNPVEKSNQVSIAGEMSGVERARARVRELTPLIYQFDLQIPVSCDIRKAPEPFNTYLRAIQDQFQVQVSFRQKQKNLPTTTVVVKGCEEEASRVKEATRLLMERLLFNAGISMPVMMGMEISPSHHAIVVGRNSENLRMIMNKTNTTIIFPDAGDPNIPPIRKGTVTITGEIHNVYLARQQLFGHLPIVMMFDLPDSINPPDSLVQKLQDENMVNITIRPKARQCNKSVVIKTVERNVGGMYISRHKLLDLEGDVVKAEVPETYKIPAVGPSSSYHLAAMPPSRGPFCHPSQMPIIGSPLSPNYLPHPFALPLTPTLPTFPLGYGYLSGEAEIGKLAASPTILQDRLMMMQLQQHQQQQMLLLQQKLEAEQQQRMAWTSPHQNGSRVGPSSELGSSISSPIKSPRNSSPVTSGGNLTNNLHKMELTTSSGIDSNLDISDIVNDYYQLSVTDRRAPGYEKKVVAERADYEQQRLRATQAMQQKPKGEERKPNPSWAGLGFSNSLPESVIRRQLGEGSGRTSKGMEPHQEWCNMHKIQEDQEGDQELLRLLKSKGLEKYVENFRMNEIDLTTFKSLSEFDLKEIGIDSLGARKKLMALAQELRF